MERRRRRNVDQLLQPGGRDQLVTPTSNLEEVIDFKSFQQQLKLACLAAKQLNLGWKVVVFVLSKN